LTLPYRVLERKRAGQRLTEDEVREVVAGATDGTWSEGQLAAFLMAAAIRGLDPGETRALTLAMLGSGERWELAHDVPHLADKHSTGGIADSVSLVLPFVLASCGVPVAMLAGRGLGHTGGTIDKLESLPGIDLALGRRRCLDLLGRCGVAIGAATGSIAPADRRLYSLRDATATVDSIPLIIASILSKKLALGAAGVVFDVKAGSGAFLPEPERAAELARGLVETSRALGTPASALITDMSQPLGRWAGNAAEVAEALACLEGKEGGSDLLELSLLLAEEAAALAGHPVERAALDRAIASGRARERFDLWAESQGADPAWLRAPRLELAPAEHPLLAGRSGRLAAIETRQLGLLLVEAGAGRSHPNAQIDRGVALHAAARIGQEVRAGDELARVYLRRPDDELARRFGECFRVEDEARAPKLLVGRVRAPEVSGQTPSPMGKDLVRGDAVP
jgi:pyrimidine-nucleoside phosphorylase